MLTIALVALIALDVLIAVAGFIFVNAVTSLDISAVLRSLKFEIVDLKISFLFLPSACFLILNH